jgi:hypothetical protein
MVWLFCLGGEIQGMILICHSLECIASMQVLMWKIIVVLARGLSLPRAKFQNCSKVYKSSLMLLLF